MRYFRLLKDSPEAPRGAIFTEGGMGYENLDYSCTFFRHVVEERPEWFEEVEQIFVRPFNARSLQEIDSIADLATDVIKPMVISPVIGTTN